MSTDAKSLRKKLRDAGLSNEAIDAAWPRWWSEEAAQSNSAQAELRFAVSRKLGLSPKSLFDEGDATFLWAHNAKFKSYTGDDGSEHGAIVSFATSLARIIASAVVDDEHSVPNAAELRALLLKNQQLVDLQSILGASWSMGIPVVHLRVVPLEAKRMAAMCVRVSGRSVILLAKDYDTPSPVGFYIAHELGHLHHAHVPDGSVLVDVDDVLTADGDHEEQVADEFALELLTGTPKPIIDVGGVRVIGRSLALAAERASQDYRVEPGMIALCYGHQTGNWRSTWAAVRLLYPKRGPAWQVVNQIALRQLDLSRISSDTSDYLLAVLGQDSSD